MKRIKTDKNGRFFIAIVLIQIGTTFLFPLLWMVNLSLKTTEDIYARPFGLPMPLDLGNYGKALSEFNFSVYFLNSVIYSVVSVCIILLLGSMLAYFLARMRFRYSGTIMNYLVLGMVVPSSVTIIPIYMMLQRAGLQNTRIGLILVYSAFGIAGTVVMMYAFMRSLPMELEEAALIDGCGIYRAFFSIILPCLKPAIFTRAVIEFMGVWNDFFIAYILTSKDGLKTLQVGIMSFFVNLGTNQWGVIGAAMVISSLPILIVYLIFSEQIENALTAGAILK
ncbi:MAG: ABC transporter permease [Clostridiales bacterium]|nr:ABC transporter permease [Clostridiales bacterium]